MSSIKRGRFVELRHLRYFVILAEALHFTRAALTLNVTQSTLSHQIRQLEDELGSPLFNRTGRAVQLTGAGRVFQSYARRILMDVDEAELAVNELDMLQRGSLRVGATYSFNRFIFTKVLSRFIHKYPGVTVSVQEANTQVIEKALTRGELDFGIAILPILSSELMAEPIHEDDYMFVVCAGHPLARRRQVGQADLARHPLAMLTTAFATRKIVDAHLHATKIAARISVECNSIEAILGLIAHGGLGSILPRSAITGHAGLIALPLMDPPPVRVCCLVRPRSSHESVAARTLIAMLLEVLAGQSGRRRRSV